MMGLLIGKSQDYSCPGLGARTTRPARSDSTGGIIAVLD